MYRLEPMPKHPIILMSYHKPQKPNYLNSIQILLHEQYPYVLLGLLSTTNYEYPII
jgi:hypothetical protein